MTVRAALFLKGKSIVTPGIFFFFFLVTLSPAKKCSPPSEGGEDLKMWKYTK